MTLKLWSIRHTAAQGNHWKYERDVTLENHAEWRKIFEKDEPGVLFLVSERKPKKP